MAAPRVFISSTCYDLSDERDSLHAFCNSFGFDITLSERGDIFYHPDLHTHTSCVRETSTCQLFILIIGGRFGGKYIADLKKSITNAEYSAAIGHATPIFTFVRQDVLNDHNLWQRNKDLPFASKIQFPSIEKQEHAEDIFRFIDEVRRAPTNNGLFGFRLIKDIHELLRKQWAGMFYDFLQNRSVSKQISITNDALGNLSIVSGKIEELVKGIYRNIDQVKAEQAIQTVDDEGDAEEFLLILSQKLHDKKFLRENGWEIMESSPPEDWWDFLEEIGFCDLETEKQADGSTQTVVLDVSGTAIFHIGGSLNKIDLITNQTLDAGYKKLLALDPEARTRLASKYFWTKADSARVQLLRKEKAEPRPK